MTKRDDSRYRSIQPALALHAISLLMATALAVSWLAGESFSLNSSPARFGIFAVVLLVTSGSAIALWKLVGSHRNAALRSVKRCCQTNFADLGEETPLESLFDARLDSQWRSALTPLAEQLRDQAVRLAAADQARARSEVKAKRFESEHGRMRRVLDSLIEPVLVIDSFEEVNYANLAARKLLGISGETDESRCVRQLADCEQLVEMLIETNQHRAATRRTAEMELAGDWYQARCSSLRSDQADQKGAAGAGAVAVLREINEQKDMQRRNAEFVSAVSHEMKTPLSGIKAYVELLADGDAEDEATREEFLGVINSQADRLQRLIDNLLNLARIEAGVVEVTKEQISLNEILEGAMEVVAPAAERKSIELVDDLSDMFLGVLADRDMILQAAINLLSNAIKYTPDGGKVTLRSQLIGSDVAFSVEDTGVGLTEEDCQRVFDKFYRVKKDKQMAAGTGLGLPLAKHIVEDVHGGRLDVESQPGVGSTFRITLTEQAQVPALV